MQLCFCVLASCGFIMYCCKLNIFTSAKYVDVCLVRVAYHVKALAMWSGIHCFVCPATNA
jgi:hypothetical protein